MSETPRRETIELLKRTVELGDPVVIVRSTQRV